MVFFLEGQILIKYSVLASGSTGNSVYVANNEKSFLIDAGLSGKKIEESLQEVGSSLKEIDGIFITHEHDDHVKGIGVLARKYNIPIYANETTLGNLPKSVGNIDESLFHIMDTGSVIDFGELQIESIPISHDAKEPVGYLFTEDDFKLSLVTDLGYVSQRIKGKIAGSDSFIFESNHDVDMLRMSSYPWSIKKRILSDVGHLSNEDSGDALAEIISGDTQKVYLAHRSKENNLLELARLTVKNILEDYGITENEVKLMDTYPNKPTKLEKLTNKKEELLLK